MRPGPRAAWVSNTIARGARAGDRPRIQQVPEPERNSKVIFIVVKFPVRPDRSDKWLPLVADFTTATRAEPGNIFFEWSRSVDNPNSSS